MSEDHEQTLARIVSDVLRKPVHREESLFDAGLNINKSLKIIQSFWSETGLELDVNVFYHAPTLGRLADTVRHGRSGANGKFIELRQGGRTSPLIVYPGGVGCPLEMKDLLNGLDYDGSILAVRLTRFRRPASSPATVEDEIRDCQTQLHHAGLRPPYRILGYSLGSVFAIELARALNARGAEVDFLAVIDPPLSEHAYPFDVWLRYIRGRCVRKFSRLAASLAAGDSPRGAAAAASRHAAFRTKALKAVRVLTFRYHRPTWAHYPEMSSFWIDGLPPDYSDAGRQTLRMKGLYRPRTYDEPLVVYRAVGGSPLECDPKLVWPRFLPQAEWVDVRGNHQSVVVGRNGAGLAADLNHRLATLDAEHRPAASTRWRWSAASSVQGRAAKPSAKPSREIGMPIPSSGT